MTELHNEPSFVRRVLHGSGLEFEHVYSFVGRRSAQACAQAVRAETPYRVKWVGPQQFMVLRRLESDRGTLPACGDDCEYRGHWGATGVLPPGHTVVRHQSRTYLAHGEPTPEEVAQNRLRQMLTAELLAEAYALTTQGVVGPYKDSSDLLSLRDQVTKEILRRCSR